jgi:hypothetical protein
MQDCNHCTYGCSKISECVLKTLHEMDDGTAYVARAASYTHKMFMKLTTVRFFHTSLIFMAKARV